MKTILIIFGAAVGLIALPPFLKQGMNEQYQCTPCGAECDNITHDKPGTCSHCSMPLVKKSTVNFREIPAADICTYIEKHPTAVLLDVRTKLEFEGKADPNFGTLKNAINIPIQELESRIGELNKYKNREIVVFCSHSHRSPRASYILTQNGFSKVSNMSGGMSVMTNNECRTSP
jgi:rhodanese-related sulfurtransferase